MNDDNAPQDEVVAENVVVDEELTVQNAYSHSSDSEETKEIIEESLVDLGFINFDSSGTDNTTSGAMVAEENRKNFRRDVYVGIKDEEQEKEFLGRIVEGPFHAPHEVSIDSAITRTTVLHPDRTRFRPSYYVSGTIEVLGELVEGERLIVTPTRPRPYSQIYIFPSDRLTRLLGIDGDFFLGHLMGYTGVDVNAKSESKNFLPRNLGIFGTVGSGKSNTTQVVMEEALKAGWAVVVVDVEGEYVCMDEPTDDAFMIEILNKDYDLEPKGVDDFKVYVPASGHSEADSPIEFKVPISKLEVEVLADILEFSEPQIRMFSSAVHSALRQSRSSGSRTGTLGISGGNVTSVPYTLQTLIDGLTEDENGNIPLIDRVASHEKSTVSALVSKLRHLGRSGMLDTSSNVNIRTLPIDDLMVGGRLTVLDVSETDDRSRNIAIAYTLQSLFERVIQTSVGDNMPSGGPRPKVLLVIEEVHTFVSKSSAAKMRAVLDNLQIISRRGRKRWMALSLVSQQPGHVPDELFELANTRFVHQLKSVSNLEPVKRTTGGVHEALWSNVPALGPGQSLVSGAVFKNPLFVNIRPALSKRLLTG